MALPHNQLSAVPHPAPYLVPDDHVRAHVHYDYERGGVALNDPSEGVNGYNWKAWVDEDDNILVARDPYDSPTVLFTAVGVTWISLAFDQNMHPAIAYLQADVCKLYWYDSAVPGQVTDTFAGCMSPVLCLDDKRQGADSYNDILFFYVRSGSICYRQQRDRFATERALVAVEPGMIVQAGMTTNLRLKIRYHRWDQL